MNFTKRLQEWHEDIQRDLPWKATDDPYKIWLSEIILQQTRVAQGKKYYLPFIERFPTVQSLAASSEDEVLSLWKGLGYYSRARNLRVAAQQVCTDFDGMFPKDYQKLLSLKGVGPYTAAAISSFAFHLPHAVVDGNVFRVLGRIYGITTPIDSAEGKKHFHQLAHEVLDKTNPAAHNQAIMDFGAVQCTPKSPKCSICPMQDSCIAFELNQVTIIPVKAKKIKVRSRHFNFFVIMEQGKIVLEKRTEKDIWKGLYQLPLIESTSEIDPEKLVNEAIKKFTQPLDAADLQFIRSSKQRLTHQLINGYFYEVQVTLNTDDYKSYTAKEIEQVGIPKIVSDFLSDYNAEETRETQ